MAGKFEKDANGTKIKIGDKVWRHPDHNHKQVKGPSGETVVGFCGCAVITKRGVYVASTLSVREEVSASPKESDNVVALPWVATEDWAANFDTPDQPA